MLDERGIVAAHVAGVSLGAAVALELAIRMPHRVKSLVLIGGGAGGPTTATPGARAVAGTVGSVLADTARHRHVWPAAALFSADFRDEHPDRVSDYMSSFALHPAPPWMTGWQALAAACFGRRASLGRVRAPTLVLHGERDVMAPIANAQLLARAIPGAELRVVEGAGHAVPLEHPTLSAELIIEWVKRHATAVPTAPRRADVIGERLTRPLSLHAGAVRNAGDGAAWVARGLQERGRQVLEGRRGRRPQRGYPSP